MKFVINFAGKSKERLGLLTNLKNDSLLPTPCFLLCTRSGAVPYLTRETLEIFESSFSGDLTAFLIPFNYHMKHIDILEEFKYGISKFIGLNPANPIILAPTDPCQKPRFGHYSNKFVSLWDNVGNRENITASLYMKGVQSLQPDIFVTLADGITPKNCPKKRILNSVANSLKYMDTCLEIYEGDDNMKNVGIFAAIEGGDDSELRSEMALAVSSRKQIDGFLLDGFIDLSSEEVVELIDSTVINLPSEKPKMYFGPLSDPRTILSLIELGVDIFDSSYPFIQSESGHALVFRNFPPFDIDCDEHEMVINLGDSIYKSENRSIIEGCTCYTCRKHTRSYINHLIVTKELLSGVLLMIHNLHHYKVFFNTIRSSIEDGSFHNFSKMIRKYKH